MRGNTQLVGWVRTPVLFFAVCGQKYTKLLHAKCRCGHPCPQVLVASHMQQGCVDSSTMLSKNFVQNSCLLTRHHRSDLWVSWSRRTSCNLYHFGYFVDICILKCIFKVQGLMWDLPDYLTMTLRSVNDVFIHKINAHVQFAICLA